MCDGCGHQNGCHKCGPFKYCTCCHRSIVAHAVRDTRSALRQAGRSSRQANAVLRHTISSLID